MAENDDYSCLEVVEKTVHVALPMSYAGNPSAGVIEYLESWRCQFIPVLDGLVVDFNKVTFENPLGRIINDQACLHYDVRAEFSLFKPSSGNLLKGVVNRISREHVGCVVHNSINASIYVSKDQEDSDSLNFVAIDSVVLFEVTNVEIHKKVIRLKGKFTNESIELTRKLYPNQNVSHIFYEEYDGQQLEQPSDTIQPKRDSKKRKRKYTESTGGDFSSNNKVVVENYLDGVLGGEVDSLSPPKNKKKKKKKHSDLDESGLETMEDDYRETLDVSESSVVRDASYSEIDNLCSSFVDGGSSKKKKKKSKNKEPDESYAEASSDYVKPRKKHKKNSVG